MSTRRQTHWHATEPRCARCGYPVHGLTTGRCPECGLELIGPNISVRRVSLSAVALGIVTLLSVAILACGLVIAVKDFTTTVRTAQNTVQFTSPVSGAYGSVTVKYATQMLFSGGFVTAPREEHRLLSAEVCVDWSEGKQWVAIDPLSGDLNAAVEQAMRHFGVAINEQTRAECEGIGRFLRDAQRPTEGAMDLRILRFPNEDFGASIRTFPILRRERQTPWAGMTLFLVGVVLCWFVACYLIRRRARRYWAAR